MDLTHNWNAWIGTDESGKGDYFGPLVVAGVYVNPELCETYRTLGITDAKTLSNQRIRKLAKFMQHHYQPYIATVEKMPPEYNNLYSQMRRRGQNLNHLLASLHAEVIQTLALRLNAHHVIVDKFAKNELINQQLKLPIQVVEMHKAEQHNIAVAAASVIARDSFLTGIETLSQQYKFRLPRGAYKVTQAGREFIDVHGTDALADVAKLHFGLTDAVIASEKQGLF